MRYIKFFLLTAIFACNVNQKETPPSGKEINNQTSNDVARSMYEDGTLRAEIPMKDGKRNGTAKQYHKNGNIFMEVDYVNDIQHGWARKYYETGMLYQETPYDSGRMHGIVKKYRTDGKLLSEMPYNFDNPCIGLKEYLMDGSARKKYPTIVVKAKDTMLKDDKYVLQVSMSDGSKNVEYYRGSLLQGNCLSNFMGNIFESKTQKGVGEITYIIPRGTFRMEEINIVAKVTTRLGNTYITQRKYNLAVENPY